MENPAKTSMELAISEKKTPRPGGCVGIFFQLFEWKRRLAQNKLFPKKILPPGRAKQCSKKFKAIEKMPSSKLHLIADENSGSFVNRKDSSRVNVNSVKEHEMRAPTLVARLMGLDSMPLVNRDKPKKASFSESKGSEREDRDFEKGSVKIDTRPQKLQKTDSSEKPMAALPFKSVLSQSRKNHRQPKLPSPVNSPRFSAGRNVKRTSQLLGAASRILEPGLLATNRAKFSIAYSNTERMKVSPPDEPSAVKSSAGATSREISDRNAEENPFVYRSLDSNSGNSFSSETARPKTIPSRDSKHLDRQYRCPLASSHRRKLRKHSSSSSPLKNGNQRQNQPSPGRVSLSPNVHGGAKDSDALNHGFSSPSRARVKEDPPPQLRTSVRKRRMIGTGGIADGQIFVDSNNSRQKNFDYDKLNDKRSGLDPCSTNHTCAKIILDGRGQAKGVHGQNRDIISFAFRSPIMEGVIFDNGRRASEDSIGAFLDQKLIKFSSRGGHESRMRASAKRSAAIVLQELMHDFSIDDGNHFSPGSVLEASFSSSSMDDGSGSRLPADIMDYTTDRLQPFEADLFDYATNKVGNQRLSEIIDNVSFIIKTIGLSGVRLTGSELSHAKEVLLSAELMFGNAARQFVDETITLFNDGNVQRGFLFDCLIEFMDSKYGRFYNSGSVSRPHGRTMIQDFGDEVREWACFLEMCLDEMVELEMSRSKRKWMEFGFEGFETGADIEEHILRHLVEEILVDMRIHPLKHVLKRVC